MIKKIHSYLTVIAFNVIIFLILVASIEFASKQYMSHNEVRGQEHLTRELGNKEYRLLRPEPYSDSPFFSKEFIEESFFQPGWISSENANLIFPKDFQGKYFNVEQNLRVTTNQPLDYKNKIYIFGGSTIYGSEVPDEFTIPSLIQKLVNQDAKPYKVINYGVTTVHTKQQLKRLEALYLNKGDIVVFYDGVNDVIQNVFFANPGGIIAQDVTDSPKFIRFVRKYKSHSYFLSWLDNTFLTKKINQPNENIVIQAAKTYVDSIMIAHKVTTAQGASFFHFLQPTIATKKVINNYEAGLLATTADRMPLGIIQSLNAAYPEFKNELRDLKYNYDLTNSFDNIEKSPYLDFCHVNDAGNLLIAKNIFDRLFEKLK